MHHELIDTVPRNPLSSRSFFRDPVGYVAARGADPAAVRLAAGTREFIVLRKPEAVWRVLVTDAGAFRQGKWKQRAGRFLGETLNTLDGAQHRERRSIVQPAVDRRRIAMFAPSVLARADAMQDRWRDGSRFRLREELDRLSLVVAGDVLLSTDLEPEASELAEALSKVMAAVPRLRGPFSGTGQAQALARVDQSIAEIIERRRGESNPGDDLVGVLLRSKFPERIVRGEVTAFLLAAVDEPPSGLAAAWYLLGQDEAAESRFHEEIDSSLVDASAMLDASLQPPYLSAVIREALRLFPPARHIDRCPVESTRVDGVNLGGGSNVVVSPLVIHRDARLFDRPSEFVPERWLQGSGASPPQRGAYLPFGAGPHTCIGEPLASLIMTLTLASVGGRWRLRLDPDPPEPVPRASALFVTLEAR